MSQCVPSWDLDHPHETSNSLPHDVPLLDYEVAELTWENGQPSMHGLGLPRVAHKYANVPPRVTITGDTLESVVNQATTRSHASATNELVPWFDHHHEAAPKTTTATHHSRAFMDALVPSNNINNNTQNQNQKKKFITGNNYNNNSSNKEQQQQHSTTRVQAGISTCMVGSCSGVARTRTVGANMNLSENGGGKFGGGRDHHHHRHMAGMEGSEYLGGGGFTSEMSPGNTSSGGLEYTRTSGDDSVCHSMSQRETCDEEKIVKKRSGILGKSSVSTKRSRAAAIHNQSERRRRDKINQRMKTLQKLVPNSSKTDKASMLDEVIEYLKQLQAQVYLMSRMNTVSPMTMLPLMQHQQLQMPYMNMMPPGMGLGMGMGLGLGSLMDFNTLTRATGGNTMPPPHAIQPNANFMSAIGSWDNSGAGDRLAAAMPPSHDALSAFLACQMQPMTMDSYSRLAAMYQQFQQTPPSASKD